ncbi:MULTISPECIES: carbohydrate ABC transporter permease [Ruminococcus]|uniref:carbohydrate ABC transporter permease n=1 Tax=Ruminococcus TaxID=1263 RepID=UPI001FA9049B|nr:MULTISPECIES: sugar ABC transporter permease [Ruminococcus]
MINTFIVSFHGNGKNVEQWVGLQNYKDILFGGTRKVRVIHESFFTCLKNTIILWVGNFIPQLALSLSLAVWFTEAQLKIPGKGFFKVVMYLPNIITAASVAVLFLQLCGQSETNPGAINYMLYKMGIVTKDAASGLYKSIPLVEGVWQSRVVVMFIQTWMWFGNTMIMLMSGIQGINPSLFEAASIDGASSGQVFRKITLPLLTPIMAYTLITSMIGGLQMFDIPFLYTKTGNVKDHLKTMAVMIYQYFHAQANENKMGYAGAVSVLLFFITLILGLIAFYMTRDKDEIAKKKQRKKIAQQAKRESKQFGGISL